MLRLWIVSFVVLFAGACAPDGGATSIAPSQAGPAEVRVATFNAEFLFDGRAPDGGAQFPWKNDPAAARSHRQGVSRVVRALNADVVVLVEVENLGVLDSMARRDLHGMGYAPYLIEGRDSHTGQDVGLLSRLPVERTFRSNERAPLGDRPDTYGVAKNLVAHLSIAGLDVSLIAVHFLAQAENPSRRPQREAQAEVIRRLVIREQAAGRHVIVAGDFNDYDGEVHDAGGSIPITSVLRTVRAAGPGRGDDLFNTLAIVEPQARYTVGRDSDGDGRLERHEMAAIDHVLLSQELRRRLVRATVAHTPEARAVSDHLPIVVTLSVNR